MEAALYGGVVRFVQAIAEGAPTFLVGLVVAGVFRRLIGPEGTRKLFGGGTIRSLLQSWGIGMLLPVCSLGVIPVAYEMRRSGVSGGAILAFALTAPLFNPLSLLYGLTLSAPIVIVAFALCSLLLVTAIGFGWNRIFGERAEPEPDDSPVAPGIKRMLAVFVEAARYAAGPSLCYCMIALLGTVILNFIFPRGSLGESFGHQDPTSPLLMLGIAPLAYATPLTVMMQIGSMFVHGNSVGAAYTLLAMGAGINLGMIAWSWRTYGPKETIGFLAVFAIVVTGIAYAIEGPLYFGADIEKPHTHAFDIYSCPFHAGPVMIADFQRQLSEAFEAYQAVSFIFIVAFGLVGVSLKIVDRTRKMDAFLEASVANDKTRMDIQIPGPVLGAISLLGMVIISGLGCYVYYPPPADTIEDMAMSKANYFVAIQTKDATEAVREIEFYDNLTRKLQVGHFLRNWELDEYQQTKAKVLRGRLEELKDLVEEGNFKEARDMSMRVSNAHRRCRKAFGLLRIVR